MCSGPGEGSKGDSGCWVSQQHALHEHVHPVTQEEAALESREHPLLLLPTDVNV